MDYKGIISFSLGFMRKPSLKLIAIALLAEAAFFACVLLLALLLFGRILLGLWSGDTSILAMLLLDPYIVEDMVFTLLFFSALLFAFVFAPVFFSIHGAMLSAGLERRGLKPRRFSAWLFLDFARLFFANAFFALFSLNEKKLLLLPAAAFTLAFVSFIPDDFISIASGVLSMALFLAYAVAVLRNAVRLCMSGPVLAGRKETALGALRESWRLTKGMFWAVLLAFALCAGLGVLLFGGCFFLLSLLLSFLLVFLVSPFSGAFQLAVALAVFLLFPFALLFFSYAKAAIFTDKALFPNTAKHGRK